MKFPVKLTNKNLVPDRINPSPDYYCTWQTQLYTCCDKGPQGQRDCLTEGNLFGDGYVGVTLPNRLPEGGWSSFYPSVRSDLYIVLDDSWDVPIGEPNHDRIRYGSQILAGDKFPSFFSSIQAAENASSLCTAEKFSEDENLTAMTNLSNAIRKKGWKALGGWICAEQSKLFADESVKDYFQKRYTWSQNAGWRYWKIDWGNRCGSEEFRRMLIRLRYEAAPDITAEQAMIPALIPSADVFRTYDVPALMSIPMTMQKLSDTLCYDAEENAMALVDCEDEVYIAAALGCSMGIMRHPMTGNLPDGRPDPSFPALHRSLKTKIDEVVRAVRFHKIAPAFAVNGGQTYIDSERFTDTWQIHSQAAEIEAWWKFRDGDVIERSGTAKIVRGLPVPTLSLPKSYTVTVTDTDEISTVSRIPADENGTAAGIDTAMLPYLAAAKNPNGVVSVVTLGRTQNRSWILPHCDVTLDADGASVYGIFGYYASLTFRHTAMKSGCRVYAQDLLSDKAYDITEAAAIDGDSITLSGELLEAIGLSAAHDGDTSEPGLVLAIEAD